jgi:hypothetical protein
LNCEHKVGAVYDHEVGGGGDAPLRLDGDVGSVIDSAHGVDDDGYDQDEEYHFG